MKNKLCVKKCKKCFHFFLFLYVAVFLSNCSRVYQQNDKAFISAELSNKIDLNNAANSKLRPTKEIFHRINKLTNGLLKSLYLIGHFHDLKTSLNYNQQEEKLELMLNMANAQTHIKADGSFKVENVFYFKLDHLSQNKYEAVLSGNYKDKKIQNYVFTVRNMGQVGRVFRICEMNNGKTKIHLKDYFSYLFNEEVSIKVNEAQINAFVNDRTGIATFSMAADNQIVISINDYYRLVVTDLDLNLSFDSKKIKIINNASNSKNTFSARFYDLRDQTNQYFELNLLSSGKLEINTKFSSSVNNSSDTEESFRYN